jgi:glycosyltransferase involved in cell wall biosynthesis
MTPIIDVLIPTFRRPAALAVTLTSIIGQSCRDFRVVVSDQSDEADGIGAGEVQAVVRVLRALGRSVDLHHHLPRRGLAEQRQFLLDQALAPYVLFIDDDVILEADLFERLLAAIRAEGCGFVGSALTGLKYEHVSRPHEEVIKLWDGRVEPEIVLPDSPRWKRHQLHNACNLFHLQRRLGIQPEHQRVYKVAWVGGCVLYDAAKLRAVGGFSFWRDLPVEHCGEDVLAQLRVMAHFGGCGVIPTGAYHQDLHTTVEDRRVDAPHILPIFPEAGRPAAASTAPRSAGRR